MAGAAFFGLAKDGYGAFSNGWGEIPSSFHGKHGNMEGQRMFPQSAFFSCAGEFGAHFKFEPVTSMYRDCHTWFSCKIFYERNV
jgi:hypothetical protein